MPADTPPAIIQPYFMESKNTPSWRAPTTQSLRIMVDPACPITINPGGKVEYACAPDQAARSFWKAIQTAFPQVCEPTKE